MVTDLLLNMVQWFYDLCNKYPEAQEVISHLSDALMDFDQDEWNTMDEDAKRVWTMEYVGNLIDDLESR